MTLKNRRDPAANILLTVNLPYKILTLALFLIINIHLNHRPKLK